MIIRRISSMRIESNLAKLLSGARALGPRDTSTFSIVGTPGLNSSRLFAISMLSMFPMFKCQFLPLGETI